MAKAVERPHPLTGVAKSWIALFGLVFIFGRDIAENGFESIREFGPFLWVVGGLVIAYILLNLVLGIISWRTTTFVADDEEFRIERNFLQRESSRISYAKIQSVDIERSLAARMLGLSSVRIDVGGAGGKRLEFLGRDRAESLRDQLLARMRTLSARSASEPAGSLPRHAQTSGEVVGQDASATRTDGLPVGVGAHPSTGPDGQPGAVPSGPNLPAFHGQPHTDPTGQPLADPSGRPLTDPQGNPLTGPFGPALTDPYGNQSVADPQGNPITDPHGSPLPGPGHQPHTGSVAGLGEPGAPHLEQVIRMTVPTLLLGLLVSSFLPWLLGGVVFVVISIILGGGFSIAAVGGLVFGLGGYVWSQVVGNWDFTLTRVPDGLHIRRGLFTKNSKSLKTDRIQAVSIHQDYLQRLTGLYRMRVTVLGFGIGEGGGETADTVLPYGRWEDVRQVLSAFWPGINLDAIELHGQPRRARWLTPLGFNRHLWGADDQTLVAHHGWLDHTISLVPHRRMQSIGITQGPLQRRLDLATVSIHTTDGPVSLDVYHLDQTDARRLFEEQVERGRVAREQPGEPSYLTALPAPDATTRIRDWRPTLDSGFDTQSGNH